jgi:hypothetical protein
MPLVIVQTLKHDIKKASRERKTEWKVDSTLAKSGQNILIVSSFPRWSNEIVAYGPGVSETELNNWSSHSSNS